MPDDDPASPTARARTDRPPTDADPAAEAPPSVIARFEVRPIDAVGDPKGAAVERSAAAMGITPGGVRTARVYLVEGALRDDDRRALAERLLADPVAESARAGAAPTHAGERTVEVHPLPGVMDPPALTAERAAEALLGRPVRVVTGWRYDISGLAPDEAARLASSLLANPVIESVHTEPWLPERLPEAPAADQTPRRVPVRGLADADLERLSREAHLFLSLQEMRAIRSAFASLGREPTDIELETLAQTWSEHCVHKTLKSTVRYTPAREGEPIDWSRPRPGTRVEADGTVVIENLLKSTVAAATHELIARGVDWTLSVFVDNAGIVRFDGEHAVCVKVETHNHPSAIEPYGGAATGIGGCIRDIIGTGLAAKPIANTDVFCVAPPGLGRVPPGCLHPKRVLTRVVEGVRDYGNRMGIPTVNGAVWFDERFVGNPLVFAGCVGVMPAWATHGEARPGDRIIALGGRTGRDGIHGATFSSAELTATHADEFGHAVQIGNAIEEKRVLDAILRARDAGPVDPATGDRRALFSAITDCGAGGFSSAVGEMGERVGAVVELDRAPLKYAGLRYDEIWISESQERMVLAVPAEHVGALRAICDEEHVELADLGVFGSAADAPEDGVTPGIGAASGGGGGGEELVLRFEGVEVGRLPMSLLHDGIPMPTRSARGRAWRPAPDDRAGAPAAGSAEVSGRLLALLADLNIASRHWIVRQYDHEVQGATAVKPLVGPAPPGEAWRSSVGPGDASVVQPVAGSRRGLAIGCGLAIPAGDERAGGEPYRMAFAAIDECVRNLVCVGADPERTAILDNFCWPGCAAEERMGDLVRACVGCYDAALAYGTPFVSGKDSLNNQFRYEDPLTGAPVTIEIPPTLLITGVSPVEDVARAVTMEAKRAGDVLVAVWPRAIDEAVAGIDGHVEELRAVSRLVRSGRVAAAHDVSEGGVLVALAEMLIGSGGLGFSWDADGDAWAGVSGLRGVFSEGLGGVVLELPASEAEGAIASEPALRGRAVRLGVLDGSGVLRAPALGVETAVAELRRAFLGTLDW